MNKFKGEILLLITAIIWGTSFISQKVAMDFVKPFTFGASRFLLGACGLMLVIFIFDKLSEKQAKKTGLPLKKYSDKDLIKGGVLCGAALFVGASLQQWGIVETTAGKAGFITALYIVIVPLLGLFMHKRVSKLTWAGVAVAIIGLYLLTIKEGFAIERGDAIVLMGTLFWALQIIVVDQFIDRVDGLKLSCAQFITAGILSAIAALLFEAPTWSSILACAGPIVYTAFMVVGVAYTFQILGQKSTPPTVAAIIMSLESVFAVISGVIMLGETMNGREIFGCILVFGAVIMTQINFTPKEQSELK